MNKTATKIARHSDDTIVGVNLWVFGYRKTVAELFTLPGWPKTLRAELLKASEDLRDEQLPLLLSTTPSMYDQITITNVCDVLNALRRHNCGYLVKFYDRVELSEVPRCMATAWLASPGARPTVFDAYTVQPSQLIKRLIEGQWQEDRCLPEELQSPTGLKVIERAFTQYNVLCERAEELDNILGG